MDFSLQQALRLSQKARALGRYNEATIILDDYLCEHVDAGTNITIYIEFALNYLAQGYLRQAYTIVLKGIQETAVDIAWDVKDPEQALLDLLLVAVKWRYGTGMTSVEDCETMCLQVWKGFLEALTPGIHMETHVKLEILVHGTWHLTSLK